MIADKLYSKLADEHGVSDTYGDINLITGEVKPKILGTREILPKSEKQTENKYIKDFNKGVNFVKTYYQSTNELMNELGFAEIKFFYSLQQFISYNDNILKKSGRKNGKILTPTDLSVLLDMDYTVVTKRINSLIKHDVLSYFEKPLDEKPDIKVKSIVVNPWIMSKGNDILDGVYRTFEKSKWRNLVNQSSEKQD